MKKLLSLLSVLTISGTALPITNATSYYKKEEKLNNGINYLQKNDDIEKLIINKRNTKNIVIKTKCGIFYSGVLFSNKLYFGSQDGNIYEYSEYCLNTNFEYITNSSGKTILNELIKKALFFNFHNENLNLKFKEIKDVNTNNLNFSNVEVTKKENYFLRSSNIKNICNNKEFINNTSNLKSFNISSCIYKSKYKLIFKILTRLVKNQENKLNGWNINYDDEIKLTDFINPNYNKNNNIINKLTNNFDLSNKNKQEQETIIFYLNEPSDKFDVNPNEKIQVNYFSLKNIKSQNMLNLKQNIIGIITAKIVNFYNEEKMVTLSIKELMKILQKYDLLLDEITINEYNNIIFNGKAYISSEIEGKIKQSIVTSII